MNWYIRTNFGDLSAPTSYFSVGSTRPSCPGTGKICAIYAYDDGSGNPVITPELQSVIIVALSTGVDQTYVLLRSVD